MPATQETVCASARDSVCGSAGWVKVVSDEDEPVDLIDNFVTPSGWRLAGDWRRAVRRGRGSDLRGGEVAAEALDVIEGEVAMAAHALSPDTGYPTGALSLPNRVRMKV